MQRFDLFFRVANLRENFKAVLAERAAAKFVIWFIARKFNGGTDLLLCLFLHRHISNHFAGLHLRVGEGFFGGENGFYTNI